MSPQTAIIRSFVCILLFGVLAPLLTLEISGRPAALAVGISMAVAVAMAGVCVTAVIRHIDHAPQNTDQAPEFRTGVEAAAEYQALHSIIDSVSDGFILWDKDDKLLLHNGHAGLNSSPTVRIGACFTDHVAAIFPYISEDTTGGDLDTWIARRIAWHASANGSHEIRMKNDRSVMLTERRAPNGCTVAIYTDITEQKIADQNALIGQRRLVHAQKLAEVGIWEWDTRTGQMYWSDILYRIHGISEDTEPLSLEQYYLIVHPASRDIVRSTYKRLLSTGGQYNQEYQIMRPDGEVRIVRAEAEAITDSTGRIIRVLGAVHDITDLKSAERGLRRAKDSADQANRAKSEFLANVGHELRTPLTSIKGSLRLIGFSEVMLQEVFGPIGNDRYREYAADIRQSGSHLLGVINDLLDFSKLEAGHLALHLEKVRVSDTVGKCVRIMRERAESENVTLVADLSNADIQIDADERKLTQILLNLVSNAVKFTPGDGLVTVRSADRGDDIEISVSDTGIGMTRDEIKLALAPFGQVDSSMNRRHTGTGLGLPLSRSLAELHGGSLEIESTPGAGTTIRVVLPKASISNGDTPSHPPLRLVMGGQPG